MVVEAGDTSLVPVNATLPMPGSMSTEDAPVTDQFNVAVAPGEMDMGLASKTFIAGARIPAGIVQLAPSKVTDNATDKTTIFLINFIDLYMAIPLHF